MALNDEATLMIMDPTLGKQMDAIFTRISITRYRSQSMNFDSDHGFTASQRGVRT
jgi:hypothetical protein